MTATWLIMKRELGRFFMSPTAYVILTVWLLWSGLSFWLLAEFFATQPVGSGTGSPLTAFFGNTMLFFMPLLVFAPIVTMRLVAEETHNGTMEPLLTSGVSEASVIVGKYLAALIFWATLWLPTLVYALITKQYGTVDEGALASAYLGVLGIGAYYMAIGLLMSTVAPNQIIAAVLTFLVLGVIFGLGIGEFVFEGLAKEVCAYISVWNQMGNFSKGVVDSRFLVLDGSIALFSVVLAIGVLHSRRYS